MQKTPRFHARLGGRKAGIRRGRRRRPGAALWVVVLVGLTVALTTASLRAQRPLVGGRTAGVSTGHPLTSAAARDRFYKGDIAKEMVAFLQEHGAPFDLSDFAEFYAKIEEPTYTEYRGYTVYKQGFGSQGPVLLQTLNILENFDLEAMGHNSPDYVHTIIEAMKLAYADRDTYYADPDFVDVPSTGLLSKVYGKTRAAEIDMTRASVAFKAGDPLPHDPDVDEWKYWVADIEDGRATRTRLDRSGRMPPASIRWTSNRPSPPTWSGSCDAGDTTSMRCGRLASRAARRWS